MKKYIGDIIKSVLAYAFSAIGGVWTAMEILDVVPIPQPILDAIKDHSFWILAFVGAAVGIGRLIYSIWEIFFEKFQIGDKTIHIRIGNILKKTGGNIMIGVNEQLITDPAVIGPSSIHRQLLDMYPGQKSHVEAIFQKQGKKGQKNSAENSFFQGKVGGKPIIFLPMSDINEQRVVTTKAKKVSRKLAELFSNQGRLQIENQTVFCPLLGTGEAGMHLTKEETIKMIVRVFTVCCENMTSDSVDKIKRLEIIVRPRDLGEISWITLKRELAFIVSNCGRCVN